MGPARGSRSRGSALCRAARGLARFDGAARCNAALPAFGRGCGTLVRVGPPLPGVCGRGGREAREARRDALLARRWRRLSTARQPRTALPATSEPYASACRQCCSKT